VSVKPEELVAGPLQVWMPYDLFLHGVPRPCDEALVKHATRIFVGSAAIHAAVVGLRPDVVSVGLPSLLERRRPSDPLTLFSFGMAHKVNRVWFEKVRDLLGSRPYTVDLSVGVHEGQPWSEAIQQSTALLEDIFGDRARLLGSLTDHAIRRQLRTADWVLLFYPEGLRDNNTTFWAAVHERARILTNLDTLSPDVPEGIVDITTLDDWPDDDDTRWDDLLKVVC